MVHDRPGGRHPQGAHAARLEAARCGPLRDQRGLRRGHHGRDARHRHRPCARERRGRSLCARPPDRRDGGADPHDARACAAPPRRKAWNRIALHRRRRGGRARGRGARVRIEDARAVVTGGASGLGAAVAHLLSERGGRVVILDVQEGPGRAAAAALGADAAFIRCDVTSEAQVNAAMEAAHTRLAGMNLLVNCAGVVGAGRVLGKSGPMAGEFFTKVIHINLIGTFLCDKAAAALMQHNAPGPDGERGLLIHT
ncbi:MAG: SDR family NAD(P)-dependent oxidoreductase, partial [Gammaproteobacteria bacterium]